MWVIIGNIFQIIILAMFFYLVMRMLRGTPGLLMLGVVVVVILSLGIIAKFFRLEVLQWLLQNISDNLPLMLIILFHSEIRRLLVFVGRHRFKVFQKLFSEKKKQRCLDMIDEIIDAVCAFTTRPNWRSPKTPGKLKTVYYNTGALIALELAPRLNEYIEKGVEINAKVSSLLLQTIFFKSTPLHDGGVIIRNEQIAAAACQFPLSLDVRTQTVHTRHSAAIGLSEQVGEAIVIVVSEETGAVSVTIRPGELQIMDTPQQLRKFLQEKLRVLPKDEEKTSIWEKLVDLLQQLFAKAKDARRNPG
ncbi:MAG: hypothetical protein GX902_07545 [Lentisphaerae bacterium]|nr:hypothetical protein [Lentisphaerota bacterium]